MHACITKNRFPQRPGKQQPAKARLRPPKRPKPSKLAHSIPTTIPPAQPHFQRPPPKPPNSRPAARAATAATPITTTQHQPPDPTSVHSQAGRLEIARQLAGSWQASTRQATAAARGPLRARRRLAVGAGRPVAAAPPRVRRDLGLPPQHRRVHLVVVHRIDGERRHQRRRQVARRVPQPAQQHDVGEAGRGGRYGRLVPRVHPGLRDRAERERRARAVGRAAAAASSTAAVRGRR
mmetsp:Transcript_7771/g.19285  ORF Transcript_7771/g.19285 Transcript_7771/m.19285 type:complete len:236 (-) Transcript_7771:1119-1826(-)